jgi:hypothetical protein
VVSDLDRRCVVEVLDRAAGSGSSATWARLMSMRAARSRWSRSSPTRPPPGAPDRASRGAHRGRPLPPRSRAPTPCSTQSGASAATARPAPTEARPTLGPGRDLAPGHLPRPPPPVEDQGAAVGAPAAPALRAVRTRTPDRRGLGAQGVFRSIHRDPTGARRSDGSSRSWPPSSAPSSPPSPPSPTASGSGAPSCSPTSTNRRRTATPKASSTRSR